MLEKEKRSYVGFMDLEKPDDRVNRETLWQVLRMQDIGGNLMNSIKSMYVNSLSCERVKGNESEFVRIYSALRQGCFVSL